MSPFMRLQLNRWLNHKRDRHRHRSTVSDFSVRQLAPDLILAIYRIVESNTIRSSIWKTTSIGWRMVFHQGTRCGVERP